MGPVVRARALQGLVPLLARHGIDAGRTLTRFGLPSTVLPDEALVPLARMNRLLDVCAVELDQPDLALQLAEAEDPSILGPLAVAIASSPTVGEAIDCAATYQFVHSPAMSVQLRADPEGVADIVAYTYDIDVPGQAPTPQGLELGIGVAHRIMSLLRPGYPLAGVHLPHAALSAPERYQAFFGADVSFGRPAAALRLPAAFLDEPLAGGNRAFRAIAVEHLDRHFPQPQTTTGDRVATIVRERLGSTVSVAEVSSLLSMHPRTLQRHLAAEETSFEAIVDEVRRNTARHLLVHTDLPMAQVTCALGLAEQASLTRSVRRWFGQTPSALRAADRAARVASA